MNPGAGGFASAYSTATDVIDVIVRSVNDAPVRTAGTVSNLTVAEDTLLCHLD